MPDPAKILKRILESVEKHIDKPVVKNSIIRKRIEYVCRSLDNRACVRLLMACMLAKIDNPEVDPRKPYTEIGSRDCFSGRTYDERYLTHFINQHRLPCNPTTAFLTPALRNINRPLTKNINLVGRPRKLYKDTIQLLDDVATGKESSPKVLAEAIRFLLIVRDEKDSRMATLIAGLQKEKDALPISSEDIVKILQQHLACKNSSRLPVLIVAAVYRVAADKLGETALPLKGHISADKQTGALGDVEICLVNDDRIITIYEMKSKRVTIDDIDRALQKLAENKTKIDNYIFITTDIIEDPVKDYAASIYEKASGMEMAILDCIGFARHFLHLFHRLRMEFINSYQELLLAEPDSAVKQPLKEAFLSLRQAAESDE